MDYKNYVCEIKLKNSDTISNINLYSTENYTEQEFQNIVIKSFLKYRTEVIIYDAYSLFEENIIKSNSEYQKIENSTASIGQFGEDTYPDRFKFINTRLLSEFIISENKDIIKNVKHKSIKLDTIVVN